MWLLLVPIVNWIYVRKQPIYREQHQAETLKHAERRHVIFKLLLILLSGQLYLHLIDVSEYTEIEVLSHLRQFADNFLPRTGKFARRASSEEFVNPYDTPLNFLYLCLLACILLWTLFFFFTCFLLRGSSWNWLVERHWFDWIHIWNCSLPPLSFSNRFITTSDFGLGQFGMHNEFIYQRFVLHSLFFSHTLWIVNRLVSHAFLGSFSLFLFHSEVLCLQSGN